MKLRATIGRRWVAETREPPTEVERRLAAQIRVKVDKRLGEQTPEWIVELARREQSQTA